MAPADRYGTGTPLVFDTSAWVRQRMAGVLDRWIATARDALLVVCPVVALELLAGARDELAFDDLVKTLAALPSAPVTRAAGAAAIRTSRELGAARRIPAADYLIAAAAAERGAGVLHYDRHYDALCSVLGIQSVWLAEPGALD